jgi:cation transport regulator ChaC
MNAASRRGGTWVFGYGSLVAPDSLAATIGRDPHPGERSAARLAGYGRRWNYGSLHLRGDWTHEGVEVQGGVVVSLGLTVADDEVCNGVIVRVTDVELERLDWRERDYQRTDVTERLDAGAAAVVAAGDRIVTYVPRRSAVERYQAARDARRAAVRRSYWELVHGAFAGLGDDHRELLASTPPPDVPVVDVQLLREAPERPPQA